MGQGGCNVGGDWFLEEEEGVGYGLMGGCGWSWIACIRILGVLPADFWDCEGLGSVKRWSRIFPYALTGASDTEVSSALPAGSKCLSRRGRGCRAKM